VQSASICYSYAISYLTEAGGCSFCFEKHCCTLSLFLLLWIETVSQWSCGHQQSYCLSPKCSVKYTFSVLSLSLALPFLILYKLQKTQYSARCYEQKTIHVKGDFSLCFIFVLFFFILCVQWLRLTNQMKSTNFNYLLSLPEKFCGKDRFPFIEILLQLYTVKGVQSTVKKKISMWDFRFSWQCVWSLESSGM
jgi:hypothetical protein